LGTIKPSDRAVNAVPRFRPKPSENSQIRWKIRQVQENEGTRAIVMQPPLSKAISARLKGPGGYYNMGNLLGLVAGTAVLRENRTSNGNLRRSESLRVAQV